MTRWWRLPQWPTLCPARMGQPGWWRRLRRHADTAYLMFAAMVTGLAGLAVPGAQSQAITSTLDTWLQFTWYAGLLMGGLLGGAGVVIGGKLGLIVERPARWILAFLCAAFGIAVLSAVGIRGVAGVTFIGLFAIACVARAYEIRHSLRQPDAEAALRAELADMRADLEALRAEVPRAEG